LEWASDQGGGFTGAAYSAIKAATTYDSDYWLRKFQATINRAINRYLQPVIKIKFGWFT
jgi:hypothetical protein